MVKKYIIRLKNHRGFVALLVLAVAAAMSTGVAATIMQTKTGHNSAIKKFKKVDVAVNQSTQSVNQGPTPTTNKIADTPQLTPVPASTQTRTTTDLSSAPVMTKAPNTATPSTPSPSPASAPAPAIDLTLGTLTFDDSTAPTVTFTLPVTASSGGSVTMVVTEQDNDASLCSKTLDLSANETTNVICSYTMSTAPHMVNATVTAGSTSVESSNVYIGG